MVVLVRACRHGAVLVARPAACTWLSCRRIRRRAAVVAPGPVGRRTLRTELVGVIGPRGSGRTSAGRHLLLLRLAGSTVVVAVSSGHLLDPWRHGGIPLGVAGDRISLFHDSIAI